MAAALIRSILTLRMLIGADIKDTAVPVKELISITLKLKVINAGGDRLQMVLNEADDHKQGQGHDQCPQQQAVHQHCAA